MAPEKILSQEEIDALLRGMENGEVAASPEPVERSDLRLYDFANQDRVIRGRMASLEVINDQFCRLFRGSLSTALRREVDIVPKSIEMKKFGEFMKTLPLPSSLHVFRMDPLRGYSVLSLEAKLIFTLLDIFFGGTGKTHYRVEGREFTAIELRLIQKIVSLVFADLQKAWNLVHPITFQHVRSEINPQFVTIVPGSDLVVQVPFEVELEQAIGEILLCIPYAVIEPIKEKLYAGFQSDQLEVDQTWISRLFERLQGAEVEVRVELGRSRVRVQDLLNWKAGDVIPLDQDPASPLIVEVEGVPKFLARPGILKGNKAIQIEGRINSA
ncbi:MAG: flagellar motor switch protein FliM [Desulfobacterota bacterium]|nr:flagellar motor switch protein FliM [Thermodesulfobacteriota bacterium]